MTTIINADTSDGLKLTSDTSGEIALQSAGVTQAKITASGLQNASGVAITAQPGRNLIINGNMAINQRAVSGTVSLSSGAYGHDRFKAGASGATYTFATTANVTTITITAGSLQQVVEGLNIQSGTHTLSWTGTAQGKIDAGSYSASGVTGTLTGGTNATVEFNTGTLTNVQLEAGTTATEFEHLQYTTQLQLCQRYYHEGTYAFMSSSATTLMYNIQFPVKMRTTPTETHQWAGVANDVYNINTAATPTFVPNGNFPDVNGMRFAYDFDAGLTADDGYQAIFTFNAEL